MFMSCLLGLTYLYLNVPIGFQQFKYWAPRLNHSVEVSSLYRQALGLPYHPVSETAFRSWNLIFLVGLFICYAVAVIIAQKGVNWRVLMIPTLLMGLITLFIPPFYATDIFYYSITGQITSIYQQSAYFQPPAQFIDSVFFPLNYWVDITSPYGPLWTSLSGLLVWLSGAHLFWTPLAFKFLSLLALWGCAALVRRIWHEANPGVPPWGVVLFLWNPLVLLDSVANGHNDILMALFIALGAFFLLKRKPLYGYVAVLLSVWIKYLPAPLAIWSLLVRLRPGSPRRLRVLGLYIIVFLALMVLTWFPHWQGPQTVLSLFAESVRGLSGPVAFTVYLFSSPFSFDPIMIITVLFITLVVCMLVWGMWALYHMLQDRYPYTPSNEVVDWATISTWVVVVLPGAHPWYIVPALALFAGLYPHAPRRAIWVYVFFSFWFFYRAVAWA